MLTVLICTRILMTNWFDIFSDDHPSERSFGHIHHRRARRRRNPASPRRRHRQNSTIVRWSPSMTCPHSSSALIVSSTLKFSTNFSFVFVCVLFDEENLLEEKFFSGMLLIIFFRSAITFPCRDLFSPPETFALLLSNRIERRKQQEMKFVGKKKFSSFSLFLWFEC